MAEPNLSKDNSSGFPAPESGLPLGAEPDAGIAEKVVSAPIVETPVAQDRILHGPIRGAVLWLAIPVLGEQILNATVTWNDAFLAGRISAEATGAVGIAGYISWLMTMLFWMVDTGASAIVARAVGSRNFSEARRTTNQAFVLALFLGTGGTVFVWLAAPSVAQLLNMHGEAAVIAVDFMRIDSLGYLGASTAFAIAACLRGAGDTRTPLIALGGVNIVNFIASWSLTFGWGPLPALGTSGIALGTVIARYSGAIWLFVLLAGRPRAPESKRGPQAKARSELWLSTAEMRINRPLITRMLRIGLPAAMDGSLSFTGHFIFMTIVTRVPSQFSSVVLYAAHVVGIRIESLSYLPANAWSVAAATMVGQNLGAAQPKRARESANEAAKQAACLLFCTGALYFFAAEPLFRVLSNDPDVWRCGTPALRGLAFVQVPLAFLIVYLGSLRGAGDTRVPMIFTAIGMGALRIPIGLFGGFVLKWGLFGAWLGMFADLIVRALLLSWRFRSGRWQRIRV